MSKPIAAFNADETIFESNLIETFIQGAVKKKLFRAAVFNSVHNARSQNNYKEGVSQSYLNHLVAVFASEINGVAVERFEVVRDEMVEAQRLRRFIFARRILAIVSDSHYRIAISGSPYLLVEPALRDLEMDQIHGSTFEIVDGKFTGLGSGIGDKSKAIKPINGHSDVTLDKSLAVGSTASDRILLESVQTAIMFNPSKALLNYGKRRRWLWVQEARDQFVVLSYNPDSQKYEENKQSLERLIFRNES